MSAWQRLEYPVGAGAPLFKPSAHVPQGFSNHSFHPPLFLSWTVLLLQNAGGMPFVGAGQGVGGSGGVEVSVLAEAKGKAEALYYVTLEVRAHLTLFVGGGGGCGQPRRRRRRSSGNCVVGE